MLFKINFNLKDQAKKLLVLLFTFENFVNEYWLYITPILTSSSLTPPIPLSLDQIILKVTWCDFLYFSYWLSFKSLSFSKPISQFPQ